ncbi:MAG TPA: SRPBCC domain-containing protein [Candidatus Polarisedimenticolia bacterium]|nr:SRPBCC domain-containing protein [Candidatus Polarisedimenticolia bacterium]
MRGPSATRRRPRRGTVREIEAPERFAFETSLPDERGTPILHVLNTVTLSEDHGRTTLTLKAEVLDSTPTAAPFLEGMHAGWSQTLDRLGEHLGKE